MPSKSILTGILLVLTVQLRTASCQNGSLPVNGTNLAAGNASNTFNSSVQVPPGPPSSNILCRSLTCNSSTCFSMYSNMTPSLCSPDMKFCELKRLDSIGVTFSVNCSNSCNATSDRCTSQSKTNCTVDCCNVTNCLNTSVSLLGASTTVAPATVTTSAVSTTTATTRIAKKCHKLKCQGEKCYQTEPKVPMDCPVGQDFCQLKKTVQLTVMTWEAGCSVNCSADKACTSTSTDCTQECCNATLVASCLKLDGSLNMPSSANLALFSPWLLIWALGLCVLAG